jgi:hypothetical protein
MKTKQVVIFDTSALNELTDDRESGAVIAGLNTGFWVRLSETNIGEVAATTKKYLARKRQLVQLCNRLVPPGDCIYPHNWILSELIKLHHQNPSAFNWKSVEVRFPEAERELFTKEMFEDDQAAQEQTVHARQQNKNYADLSSLVRNPLDEYFAKNPSTRPNNFSEYLSLPQTKEAILTCAKLIYKWPTNTIPDDTAILNFIDICPPFRALVYALAVGLYEYSFRDLKTETSFRAGAFDTYMSVYLPYCDQFVTAEKRERQRNALELVKVSAKLPVQICSYNDFRNRLFLK